jgi:copper chaperone CopZ
MSRRRGEFEHRTSIFEGAFRAWSHLGGLDPEDLENRPVTETDPLTNPIENDPRLASQKKNGELKEGGLNLDGSRCREYPYEPLPRAGLSHPYVQAILSPWLGPNADNEAIQLGLTTLRTWWQHRRKGESGSAMAALGTEKMNGVVEGYTRHFYTLAHCLVINDSEQPPRTLYGKMKEMEKMRSKNQKKRIRDDENVLHGLSLDGNFSETNTTDPNHSTMARIEEDLTDTTLSPLERLHAAQRRQLAESGGLQTAVQGDSNTFPRINVKGKCIPGNVDLGGVMDAVNRHATQLAHRGSGAAVPPRIVSSSDEQYADPGRYGDPNTTPVVFVSGTGDIQIALGVDGITCAHCVKIVETVLKGCNGNKSPIDGLLDAAADRDLMRVLIRIDQASNAKRIAFEAARNLAMVGYTAKAKEMSIVGPGADKKVTMDLGSLSTAFEVVANTDEKDMFDWSVPCTCPDNGVLRSDCSRHSQMNKNIFEAFEMREQQVTDYMAGCGMKYGMDCTCGPGCRCKNCPTHSVSEQLHNDPFGMSANDSIQAEFDAIHPQQHHLDDQPIHVDQRLDFFGMGPPTNVSSVPVHAAHMSMGQGPPAVLAFPDSNSRNFLRNSFQGRNSLTGQRNSLTTQRNPSIISFGGPRHMSITSETTFGRAMSGLSALSIDWENLDDFDLEVDHSSHITNQLSSIPSKVNDGGNTRRSSLRRSFVQTPQGGNQSDEAHVSFKV